MDHDRLFKELLTTFFAEFVELFLPDLAAYIDWDHIEFIDKEIFTDIAARDRHEVDLLVKTRFRDRGDGFFLVHLEHQASAQADFPQRMFRYFSRLYEKFGLPVFPVVLFSYDQPLRAEPDRFELEFPNFRVLDFNFRVIQLNRLNWRDYVRNPNPVASALMTKMRIAPEDRPRVKLECLRMMATLKLDRARSTLISVFMDAYLKLTSAEQIVYNREMEVIEPKEREAVMQWTNEWIERGKVEGRVEGRTEGRMEGQRETIVRLLRRRFGSLPADLGDRIAKLADANVNDLVEAVLDFKNIDDAVVWVEKRS